MKKNNEVKTNFETSLKQLEEIVDQLESGDVDLEKSVELYEQGIKLKKVCEEKLKKLKCKLRKLS